MLKRPLWLIIFSFFFLTSASQVKAAGEFTTGYQVNYQVTSDGRMLVNQEISLTNKLANVYATEYSLSLEKGKPKNVEASDSQGKVKTTIAEEGDKTKITLFFNDQITGKDNVLRFKLSYEIDGFLKHNGDIWEVTLPKLSQGTEIDTYQLTLKIPANFGKPAYISPEAKSQKNDNGWQIYTFNKEQLVNSGVIAAFGQFQTYDFVIVYHLRNNKQYPIKTKIALPPDTNYQQIAYDKINPLPENVELDEDGNWLATYAVGAKGREEIVSYGQVRIFAQPQPSYLFFKKPSLDQYVLPQKYWESESVEIKEVARTLKTPREIFDFVVNKLDYDYDRIKEGAKRFGAVAALQQPTRSTCMEFSDLFVAIARANGIPARVLDGYAQTDNPYLKPIGLNQDILHAWPEYWDETQARWVQIDPTWQKTAGVDFFNKMDLGHFVFAIHGQDSSLPLPAGAYKDSQQNKKDIQVSFGQAKEAQLPKIDTEFIFPNKIYSEKENMGVIKIKNLTGQAIYNLSLGLQPKNTLIRTEKNINLAAIPPYGYQEITVRFSAPWNIYRGQSTIKLFGNGQEFVYNFRYESLLLGVALPASVSIFFALLLGLMIKKHLARLRIRKEDGENQGVSQKTSGKTWRLPF